MKVFYKAAAGGGSGLLNGLLGAGGGMIVVPFLKTKIDAKKAHATSVFIIFGICLVSTVIYLFGGRMQFSDALPYIPAGLVGAGLGAWLLQKINQKLLRKAFALLMLWAAVRLLLK